MNEYKPGTIRIVYLLAAFLFLAAFLMATLSCKKSMSSTTFPPPIQDTDVNTTVNGDTAWEIGGSNYAMYSVGNYLEYPTDSDWVIPYNLRPVIGTYHLAPDTVRKQLAIMYNNGQRKIALDLWYADLSRENWLVDSPLNGHLVNANYGKLLPQHQQNLINLLNDIVNQGFNQIMFRFDTQGDSDPRGWGSVWYEDRYLNDWSFVSSTKATIQKTLNGKAIKVLYDLDGELAGIDSGQAKVYFQRMWGDYVKNYGSHNTIGFSFAVSPPRSFSDAIALYDKVGKRPDIYGFDIYGDEFAGLAYLQNVLQAAGDQNKPVFMEEAYYNDQDAHLQIMQARSALHLNLKFIMQWPVARGAIQPNFSVQFPADYSAYLQ
jgi:hypothetical protein